jgi:DNA-nicking Smr family endonuclease
MSEDGNLFSRAMRGVVPIACKGREVVPAARPEPRPVPGPDASGFLRDLLEGRLDFSISCSDEYMEGSVIGTDPVVLGRLRAGRFSPEAHLDLHGQNARQAFASLSWFIRRAYLNGLRTVIVVTGRGKNSPNHTGVLRPLLSEWLDKDPFKRMVLAFCTARPADGGPGAVYVLLRKYKKKKGKIIWDRLE